MLFFCYNFLVGAWNNRIPEPTPQNMEEKNWKMIMNKFL